jgi:hypothetical protein
LCGFEAAPKRSLVHVVGEDALAVDLDDGDQLAVGRLELRIAIDRDLLELEAQLVPERPHLCQRSLAEVATHAVVERDSMDRGHE